jgi:hypothetical protein
MESFLDTILILNAARSDWQSYPRRDGRFDGHSLKAREPFI